MLALKPTPVSHFLMSPLRISLVLTIVLAHKHLCLNKHLPHDLTHIASRGFFLLFRNGTLVVGFVYTSLF